MLQPFPAPATRLLTTVDGLGNFCARLGDLIIISISVMLFYEVGARYLFNSPTQWSQDVAVTLQVWFTYLGMAYVSRQRQLIRITALLGLLPARGRQVLEGLSLIIILAFSTVAVVKGWGIVEDSIHLGRRQPTMLELPNWISELPVVIGFTLLAVQALADLLRLPFRPAPEFTPAGEHAPPSDEFGTPSQRAPGTAQP